MTGDHDDDDLNLFRNAVGPVRRLRETLPPPTPPKPKPRARMAERDDAEAQAQGRRCWKPPMPSPTGATRCPRGYCNA